MQINVSKERLSVRELLEKDVLNLASNHGSDNQLIVQWIIFVSGSIHSASQIVPQFATI